MYLRRELGEHVGDAIYSPGSGDFTVKIYHGGKLLDRKDRTYVGGVVDYFDGCNADRFSLTVLDSVAKKLGYKDAIGYWYNTLGYGEDRQLTFAISEQDALFMAELGAAKGVVEVFFIHNDDSGCSLPLLGGSNNAEINDADILNDNGSNQRTGSAGQKNKQKEKQAADFTDSSEDDDYQPAESTDVSSSCSSFIESDFENSDDEQIIWTKVQSERVASDNLPEKVNDVARCEQTVRQKSKSQHQEDPQTEKVQLFMGDHMNVSADSSSYNSDDFLSQTSSGSDGDGLPISRPTYERFRPEIDMNDPKFSIGLVFSSKQMLKDAVRSHKIKHGKVIKFKKSDQGRLLAICCGKNCKWFFWASKVNDTTDWQIRTAQLNHTCGRSFNPRIIGPTYLAKKYIEDFRCSKGFSISEFIGKVHRELNYNINADLVYRAKAKAKVMIEGKYKEQYKRLWDYVEELRNSDPSNTIILWTEPDHKGKERFKRFYMGLAALKEGFKRGCRNVVCLDGCHLRGPHPGILLTAVGIDPNNSVYPVVICVVEVESKSSWKWFLEILIEDLGIYEQEKWTFMSDRQKGLVPAIGGLLPRAEHRHCVRHLHNNFKKLHPGNALKDQFWACARATHVNKFLDNLAVLKEMDESAYNWLVANSHPSHWSRSHFKTFTKCDILLNNLCESFNSTILEARSKPILGMLESIRVYLMTRQETKREWMRKKDGLLCPKIQKYIEKLKEKCASFIPRGAGGSKYQVEHMWGDMFAVDLQTRTCSCKKWELCGIPCVHAVSAIACQGEEVEMYVADCYYISTYMKVYEPVVQPISGPSLWPRTDKTPPLPPKKLRLPGRPKQARRREHDEAGGSKNRPAKLSRSGSGPSKCRKCREKGHNSRTCPENEQQREETEQASDNNNGTQAESSTILEPNMNKCGRCGDLGHNRRTCVFINSRTAQNNDESANIEPMSQASIVTAAESHGTSGQQDVSASEIQVPERQQGVSSVEIQGAATQDDVSAAEIQGTGRQEGVLQATRSAGQSREGDHQAEQQNPTNQVVDGKKKVRMCSMCGKAGHNRQTCTTAAAKRYRESPYHLLPPRRR